MARRSTFDGIGSNPAFAGLGFDEVLSNDGLFVGALAPVLVDGNDLRTMSDGNVLGRTEDGNVG